MRLVDRRSFRLYDALSVRSQEKTRKSLTPMLQRSRISTTSIPSEPDTEGRRSTCRRSPFNRKHISQPVCLTQWSSTILRFGTLSRSWKQGGALAWLETRVAPVDVSSVSIDDHGRVVIKNQAFAAEIAKRLAVPGAATAAGDTACSNGLCWGRACCCTTGVVFSRVVSPEILWALWCPARLSRSAELF